MGRMMRRGATPPACAARSSTSCKLALRASPTFNPSTPIFTRLPRSLITCLTAGLLASAALHADQDAPPVDVGKMLKDLLTVQQQGTPQVKTLKQNALQQVTAAAANPEGATAFWIE